MISQPIDLNIKLYDHQRVSIYNMEKLELEQANLDLREQIKLIESKARPDQVWATAFSEGFSISTIKCNNSLIPLSPSFMAVPSLNILLHDSIHASPIVSDLSDFIFD